MAAKPALPICSRKSGQLFADLPDLFPKRPSRACAAGFSSMVKLKKRPLNRCHFGRGRQVVDRFTGDTRILQRWPEKITLVPLVEQAVIHADIGTDRPGVHGINSYTVPFSLSASSQTVRSCATLDAP